MRQLLRALLFALRRHRLASRVAGGLTPEERQALLGTAPLAAPAERRDG